MLESSLLLVNPRVISNFSFLSYHVEPQDLLESLPLKQNIILPLPFVIYVLKHYVMEWQVVSCATNILCINLGSLDTKILYLEPFQKFFSHPSVSWSSSIGFHLQPCSKGLNLHQAPHVCVISWVYSELVQGLLSFAHMILPVMCLNSHWLWMPLHSLWLLFMRSLVLRIFPCVPWCFHLLHDRTTNFPSCINTAS